MAAKPPTDIIASHETRERGAAPPQTQEAQERAQAGKQDLARREHELNAFRYRLDLDPIDADAEARDDKT